MLERVGTLLQIPFCWDVLPQGNIEEAECAIFLSMGCRKDGVPGTSNEALGIIAAQLWERYRINLLLENEIAQSRAIAGKIPHIELGSYLTNSWEVLSTAKIYMQENSWQRAVIAAKHQHLWRSVKTAEMLRIEWLLPPEVRNPISLVPWDRENVQWRARNSWLWPLYEIPARLWSFGMGWI